uniref:Uncharacterized protein n=1 Tax=Panagrolaimus sp. PS1159 TaxID=55785 RepID=A0AC35ESV2_9BILA
MFVFSILKSRFSSKKKFEHHSKSGTKKIPKPTLGALIDAFFLHRKLTSQVSKKQILAAKQQNCNKSTLAKA